jgi:polysaccharide deacetylase family protein (PEP-CTERM system associated)
MNRLSGFSCEMEDWFHILDYEPVRSVESWSKLPLSADRSIERLLDLLAESEARATFFCLGWMAERMPGLVRKIYASGHEIGSHGYGHVLAYSVGRKAFERDIVRAKEVLEDITGIEVIGFRSPGFCVRQDSLWVLDAVAKAGYRYDASVFPAHHGHGGLAGTPAEPHVVTTAHGPLVEIPASTVKVLGRRMCLFGGGHLRLAPLPLIRWGIRQLHHDGLPLVVYIHPRELDPDHPRLPLPLVRRFKCYVNLRSTLPKLKWLLAEYRFTTMAEIAARVPQPAEVAPLESRTPVLEEEPVLSAIPVVPVLKEAKLGTPSARWRASARRGRPPRSTVDPIAPQKPGVRG